MSGSNALAVVPSAPSSSAEELRPSCVCIDIETPASGEAVLHKLAAFRPDTGESVSFGGKVSPAALKAGLDALATGAKFVLGHNVRRHDLPVLTQLFPGLMLTKLPVIDTLELSPLAYPENPYHRLVKDYKLVSDARNHPMRDAELSFELFREELQALASLQTSRPDDVALFHFLTAAASVTADRAMPSASPADGGGKGSGHPQTNQRTQPPQMTGGLDSLFTRIRRATRPTLSSAATNLARSADGKVCATRLQTLIGRDLLDESLHSPIAYFVAWLRVAGGNSVLPPWVRSTFPETARLVRELRDVPCGSPECAYCHTTHDPEAQLAQYFGLPEFRSQPQNEAGGSLQRDVTVAGLRGESLLAILPTGSGKSLCYQIPALAHYARTGQLTVIVSPLQSLMKDQVDNLVKRGIYCAVALNGLLTPPERRSALDKIRLGDAGIVLVSPEQFRNKSFTEAISWRDVATWVFDEAHCLSRWGHDFRTDYLYVATFIRERYGSNPPPVACFTATAKQDVIEDLRQHFKMELGIDLAVYNGGHERDNLHYEVLPVTRAEKPATVLELLRETLGNGPGGAVVFTATRKNAETMAELIAGGGWSCAHFHAGLEPGTKREIQQNFVAGSLRVMVATNAFGMGVDKPDVRLVVHADIPGSLENYLQEAGRAGRDSASARCVLLYEEEDVESQFALSARSRLTHRDFVGVLKALRKRRNRLSDDAIVVTAHELLLGADDLLGIDPDDRSADTKVRTAIAWLERARLVKREENQTRVYSASLKVASLEEANAKLAQADLSDAVRDQYRTVLELVMGADAEDGISTDEIMVAAAIPAHECFRTLHNLESLGLLSNDLGLRVVLRKGVTDPSDARLARVSQIERALIDLMVEEAPDADSTTVQVVSLRPLCEGVRERVKDVLGPEAVDPERLLDLLRAMSQSFGAGSGKRAILTLQKVRSNELRVRVQRPWSQIRDITDKRRAVAQVLLKALLAKLPEGIRSADAIVECKLGELQQAIESDLDVSVLVKDPVTALEQALLYLHDTEVLILDKGRTVFRSAMTLKLLDRDGASRFLKEDYTPLERHYAERNFQIHVMHEYAKRGLRKAADALALVTAYFVWTRDRFVKEHFSGRKELLELATTAESYQKIVESLRHPIQQQLVQAREGHNRLVLAGPGSGKTKVIVHRVGYLLRMLRVPPESIIVLAFNRSAAVEVRRRLRGLVGSDSAGVTVLTYHAIALRLTGMSLGTLAQTDQVPDFDEVLHRAVELLGGKAEAGTEADELRDRLLKGYRFILVDEYQDIDAVQYDLVSALAGRTLKEGDTKLTIMAVGDDDQNIYSFRKTSVEFIRRFEADYGAEKSYLVENFRSTQHIISAGNSIIQRLADRMKIDSPIRIDHMRSRAPAGGRWESLDPVGQGRVQLIRVPKDRNVQAQLAMAELLRLRDLDPTADWSDFAVLARTNASLEPIRAYCELNGIAYRTGERGGQGGGVSAIKTREGYRVLATLRRRPNHLVYSRALSRWLSRLGTDESDNPWIADLRDCAGDLESAVGGGKVARADAIDWLYESAGAHARQARGHLNLLTAHGAKGREFAHVVVLDTGDWPADQPDERRLLYVAMTRAKETLTLFQAVPWGNPMLAALDELEAIGCIEPKVVPMPLPALNRLHRELTLQDVDLGFAGRQPGDAVVHQALAELKYGDPISLVSGMLLDGKGRTVGKLSKKCQLPRGTVLSARAFAVIHRKRTQSPAAFQISLKVEEWETVLPELVIGT